MRRLVAQRFLHAARVEHDSEGAVVLDLLDESGSALPDGEVDATRVDLFGRLDGVVLGKAHGLLLRTGFLPRSSGACRVRQADMLPWCNRGACQLVGLYFYSIFCILSQYNNAYA